MSVTRILRFSQQYHHCHQSILQMYRHHHHRDGSRHHPHLLGYLQHRSIHISKLIVLIGAPGSGKGTQSRLLQGGKIVCAGDVLREEVRTSGNEELAQILNNGEMAPEHITSALLRRKIIRLEEERTHSSSSSGSGSGSGGSSSSSSGNASSGGDNADSGDGRPQQWQQGQQCGVDSGPPSEDSDSFYILDGYPRSPQQAEHFVQWFDEPTADQGAYFHRDSTVIIHLLASKDSIMERLRSRLIHNPSGRTYNTVFNPPRQVDPPLDDVTGEPLTRRDDDISPDAVRNRIETYRMRTIPTMEVLDQHGFVVDDVKEGTIEQVHERILDILRDRGFISAAESNQKARESNADNTNNAADEYSDTAADSMHLPVDRDRVEELVEQQRKTSDRASSYKCTEKKE